MKLFSVKKRELIFSTLGSVALAPLQALAFFTILPFPQKAPRLHESSWTGSNGWAAALCGALIGSLCAGVYALSALLLPSVLCAVLAIAASVLVTGAMHEDGLADFSDALGVKKSLRLETMHEPRIGSYAVLALLLSCGIRVATLATFDLGAALVALVVVHTSARAALPFFLATMECARGSRLAAGMAKPSPFSYGSALLLSWSIIAYLLPIGVAVGFTFAMLFCMIALRGLFRRIGDGISGDQCGAAEQGLECVGLLFLCAVVAGSN